MNEIPLRHGATWGVLAMIYVAVGVTCVVLAVSASVQGQPVAAAVGLGAATIGAVAIAMLFLAGARRPPVLRLVANGIVVDLPGVLREPFLIPQHQVRHVYLRDAYDIKDDRPRGMAVFRRRDVPAGSLRVPSLSFGSLTGPAEWRLLLLVDPPIVFHDLVRRTTLVRVLAAGSFKQPTYLPTYRTVARALACEPDRLQEAVDILFAAGYPVTRPPLSDAHLAWLRGG